MPKFGQQSLKSLEILAIPGIYMITSPCNKAYVGSTINVKQRLSYYKRLKCNQQPKIYNSIKKYGFENHVIEILEYTSLDKLFEREVFWGKKYNVLDKHVGLNLRLPKSDELKCSISNETRNLLSKINKGQGLGRKLSEETKAKMSKSLLTRPRKRHSIETKNKISKSRKGIRQSDETREKMRESNSQNRAKLVVDTVTGIFFNSAVEASKAYGFKRPVLLQVRLNGRQFNDTNLIYV